MSPRERAAIAALASSAADDVIDESVTAGLLWLGASLTL
jgi:hypothetical protein